MWHVEIPSTSPDRGNGGSFVVVDRLLAGVAISVSVSRGKVPSESALLGPDRKQTNFFLRERQLAKANQFVRSR